MGKGAVSAAIQRGGASTHGFSCGLCRLERAEFPVQLLPKAMHAPCIAGALHDKWHGIPEGTPLGIAMGDLQCSILAAHPTCTDAGMSVCCENALVNHIFMLKGRQGISCNLGASNNPFS